mmetsp:Transcript_56111/g.93520  ORF Transcript_56111/g.93520 Transcript_56111/m.93520 type:complete len:189 (-) Transcript_56111:80-646(-)|eukprot:CAMPEP_0202713380 /NCGR_PEP_ID=MMETSP1385-20130828/53157_1 /ASSEMBLY_ACC=CAM_ASM_000861 /TAXON_ID=933848 /ORGANISM="Elphidium margaritaceum" /LENGTH=188 /DNA_ID=CAMNT_0049373711 /DNA_START=83 /DNA_END=649 /DNA_ORIENTATION=+
MFGIMRPFQRVQACVLRPHFQCKKIHNITVQHLIDSKAIRGLNVIKARQDDSLKHCATLMENHKIGAVMIEDSAGKVVGILTARDVQKTLVTYSEPGVVLSKDVMTPRDGLATAKVSDSLTDIATVMMERNIRHLPVINKENVCTGMLSIKDVVGQVLEMERTEKEELENIVTDSYSHRTKKNLSPSS